MSEKQLRRHHVILKTIDGNLTIAEAAISLGLSERQVLRLKKGVKEKGPKFLIHKNTGRKPAHAISEETKKRIIELKKNEVYKNANFTHFQELLKESEKINISYDPLYRILTQNGIQSPKKRRRFKPHRRRSRKLQEGLLIQIDASPYDWFDIGEYFDLHGSIDDATGKITGLYITKYECMQGYFETLRRTINNFGIPISIYSDRHTIFKSPKKLTIEEELAGKTANPTQFGRALDELGIKLITARSPQAKGRIERLWGTLQSRLPVLFKKNNIKTIDEANKFLLEYVHKFNSRFAVDAKERESAYIPLNKNIDLDNILCVKLARSYDNGGVFSFYGKHFKISTDEALHKLPAKAKVNVFVSPSYGVRVEYKKDIYDTVPYIKPSKKNTKPSKKKNKWKPKDSHYYKYGHNLIRKVTFEDKDKDILKMLEDIFLRKGS